MMAMNSPDTHADGLVPEAVKPLRYDAHHSVDPFEVTGILRSLLPDGVRVLDVGCGTGSLTAVVTNGKRTQVLGIEPDRSRAEVAASRGLDVFCGTLTKEYLDDRELFDVIIFADVLEHVADPAALLRLAAQGLRPEGVVLISVPNAAHWSMRLHVLRGRFNYTATGIRDATHLRWFTFQTIQDLLRSQHFEVLAYKPAAGTWMPEYKAIPWKWLPYRIRRRLIAALTRAIPTLFACQHILKARRDTLLRELAVKAHKT
jgi:methionine biosynthesis protein MetW